MYALILSAELFRPLVFFLKWNGKKLSDSDTEEIQSILNQIDKASKQTSESNLNLIDMFKKSNLSKTLIILFSWITTCLGSYTLFLNSTRLHGDLFLNFLLSALADFPGIRLGKASCM